MSLALHPLSERPRLVLPPESAEEAALVPGAQVYRARHLLDVAQQFLPGGDIASEPPNEGWVRVSEVARAPLRPTPGAGVPGAVSQYQHGVSPQMPGRERGRERESPLATK